MIPCVGINPGQDFLRPIFPIFGYQSLNQQPCCGGGIDIRNRNHSRIFRIRQILYGCRDRKIIFLHHFRIQDNCPFLSGNRRTIGRKLVQCIYRKGKVFKHLVLFLCAVDIKRTHRYQIRLNIASLCQKLSSQLGGSEGLENILIPETIVIQRVLHGRNRFVVRIGINNHFFIRRTFSAACKSAQRHCRS